MCPLIQPGISDTSWFDSWKEWLSQADGVLVVFTEAYRWQATAGGKEGAIRMEAEVILERWQRDPAFMIYALDPSRTGQDYANLKFYLEVKEAAMNAEAWIDFVRTRRQSFWERAATSLAQAYRSHFMTTAADRAPL